MNKKGFTLVELIAILVIIGVIVAFALPNITSTLERQKKDQMIADAKDFVEKTKNYMLKNAGTINTGTYTLILVDPNKDIKESPYGKEYDRNNSKVTVSLSNTNNSYVYSIVLKEVGDNPHELKASLDGLNGSNKYSYIS